MSSLNFPSSAIVSFYKYFPKMFDCKKPIRGIPFSFPVFILKKGKEKFFSNASGLRTYSFENTYAVSSLSQ